jgi:hypothetical protein
MKDHPTTIEKPLRNFVSEKLDIKDKNRESHG